MRPPKGITAMNLVGAIKHPVGMAAKAVKRAYNAEARIERQHNRHGDYQFARNKYKPSTNTKTQSTKTKAAKKRPG